MDKQILFNFILKRPIYELGNKTAICHDSVDLNGCIIKENYLEEFKTLIILENK